MAGDADRLVKIGEASKMLGVTPGTLRNWESTGELVPTRKTPGGTRLYRLSDLMARQEDGPLTVGYARAHGRQYRRDLDSQQTALERYCEGKGWRVEIIRDHGSGINGRKPGLQRLIELIMKRQVRRLVMTHKDRLLRFGGETVFTLCALQRVEVVIMNTGIQPGFVDETPQDVSEIMATFHARFEGQSLNDVLAKMVDGRMDDDEVSAAASELSSLG